MIEKINLYLDKWFGIEIVGTRPKEAIRYAKKHFKNKKITAVEIGVLRGQNSEDILKSLNIEKIYLIDPYTKYSDYKEDGNYNNVKIAEIQAKKRLKKFKEKIIWVKDYSDRAIKKILTGIDFIYIDGNHEHKYVKKDLELYWKKLNNGGIFSGHDIQYSEVSKAVLEFSRKNNLKVLFGDRRDWWIVK